MKSISDNENINSVNPLHLIIGELDGYIDCNSSEESNGNIYLTFVSTEKHKEVLKKYTQLWNGDKYLIKTIHVGKEGEYKKDSMKIYFRSDDNLPLNKILELHMLIVRSVFEEDGKYYQQVFLD